MEQQEENPRERAARVSKLRSFFIGLFGRFLEEAAARCGGECGYCDQGEC